MVHALGRLVAAQASLAGDRCEIDAGEQADGADVLHVGLALQAHHGIGKHRLELGRPLEQALVLVDVERGEAGGGGQRMARVGVAVEQLHQVLGAGHEGVVDLLGRHHARHRHGGVGHTLGKGDHVGGGAVALGSEGVAEAAETGDDLIEDQQDAVLGGDLAQPLQVALGRRQDARGSRHRLDDDGGNGGGIVQVDEAGQLVRQVRAPFRLALGEGLLGAVVGAGQVIDAGQHVSELLAVGDDAADRNAAEADAVVAALAADEPSAGTFAAGLVIAERDLERSVDRLAPRVGEEGVIEVAGCQQGEARGQLEHLGVAVLKGRRVVELGRHLLDGLDDGLAAVAGVDAEQARGGVGHLGAVGLEVVHALGAGEQARAFLEGAVGGEGHPIGLELIGVDVERCHGWSLRKRWNG